MPKPKTLRDELSDPSLDGPGPGADDGAYELPSDLDGLPDARATNGDVEPETLDDAEFTAIKEAITRPRTNALKIGAVVGAILLVGGGLLWYRDAHRTRVVRQALSEAEALMRLDTASAYRAAADKLEVPAQLDPVAAGSARAFALAMLACDYRDAAAESSADALLLAPERAEAVPDDAYLARAALGLARGAMGDASNAASRVRARAAWANALQARIAMTADRPAAALDAASAAADGGFAAGLAIQGDVARRASRDPAAARAAYTAALAAAGEHGPSPRATFGVAKLALADQMPPAEAVAALERLLQDGGTPAPERGRAALHLAALRLRAGDAGGAQAALDLAALDPGARPWAEHAARVASVRRGVYRAPVGAPPSLVSRSDDDPPEAEPPPPPAPEPKPAVQPKPARAKAVAVGKSTAHRTAAAHATAAKKALPKKPVAKKAPAKKPAKAQKTKGHARAKHPAPRHASHAPPA